MNTCLTVSVSNHLSACMSNCILYAVCVPAFADLTVCLNLIFGLISYLACVAPIRACPCFFLHVPDYMSIYVWLPILLYFNCLYACLYVCIYRPWLYVWFWHFALLCLPVAPTRLLLAQSDPGKRQKCQTTGYYHKQRAYGDVAQWDDDFDTHICHINLSQLFGRLGSLKPVVYLWSASIRYCVHIIII